MPTKLNEKCEKKEISNFSSPFIAIVPLVYLSVLVRILNVVDLPAPLL